jgi:adenine-specific DNA-methyltransferase
MGKKYALIIGVSTYKDQRFAPLTSPAADIERLTKLLKTPEIGNFTDVKTMEDGEFGDVLFAIADLFADKKRDDLLLLYFSGHGVKDDRGELYLAVKNTRYDRLSATAIDTGFIKDEMETSRSRRQVIVLDSCFSGAFSKGFKGTGERVITSETFQTQGVGKIVLAASTSTQYAFEGGQAVGSTINSLFTHFLLEGLENGQADRNNDGSITVDEWYDYAYDQIENNHSTQKPQKFIYGQEGEQIEIAHTKFVGSFLTDKLLPASNIRKDLEKVANLIANLPTPSLLQVNKHVHDKADLENISSNFIINGDNLLAMKSIFSTFAGKIKCIYIDPPYNSNANLNFEYKEIGISNSQKKRKSTKLKSDPHEFWTQMMHPRLLMMRELLSDDGVIFISIDDTELCSLKWLMDEIFGSINWVCTFVWKKRRGFALGNHFGTSIDHEYIVCYTRGGDFHFKGMVKEIDANKYSNPDNDPRGSWLSHSLVGLSDIKSRPNLSYEITDPQTGISYKPLSQRAWMYSKDKMQSLVDSGIIIWPKSPSGQPRQKRYLTDIMGTVVPISSVIDLPTFSKTRFEAEDGTIFNSSKPIDLIKLLINQIPGDDFIILDAFAGSGTTGQAVIDLNQTDGGKRKFILMETDPKICSQIINKRLQVVVEKLASPLKETSKFNIFTLSEPQNV